MKDVGVALMKLKILFGYTQCLTNFGVTFDVPWPKNLLLLMKLLEFTSFDVYAFFGEVSCRMQTGFTQKFVFHMSLGPAIAGCFFTVWTAALIRRRYCCCPIRYTRESLKTRLFTSGSLLSFGLYTGLSTRIFRLFKCREVHGVFYLTDDYSVTCYDDNWWWYGSMAILCIFIYVIGVPLIQFISLWKYRHHLHESTALDKTSHRQAKKRFGAIYENYTEDCYYYDLID